MERQLAVTANQQEVRYSFEMQVSYSGLKLHKIYFNLKCWIFKMAEEVTAGNRSSVYKKTYL